ncbi:OmpA family protein [Pontibacter locisalis]|uniref:OmpA family protein n=1 Tax=Pontibacter locisalis TaxID=1719035 RepID=A0ABW5ISH6_9BACT
MDTKFTFTILAAAGLLMGCNEVREDSVDSATELREIATEDTAVMYDEDFREVDFGAPVLEEPALSAAEIEVRGAEGYRIYSVGEDIMFDLDKAQIRPSGEQKLQEIVKIIKEQNPEGVIRVYGFTDSLASESYNKQLALERARAVEDWLQQNSGLDTARLKLMPIGEHWFEATNETARGRQQNRRVEIVVVEK